jgi:hypothetical protein
MSGFPWMKALQMLRPFSVHTKPTSSANAARHGRWRQFQAATGCRALARLHRSQSSNRATSERDCDSAIEWRKKLRRGPLLPRVVTRNDALRCLLVFQTMRASPPMTSRHLPGEKRNHTGLVTMPGGGSHKAGSRFLIRQDRNPIVRSRRLKGS